MMVQFIEFYVRADNAYSADRVRYMLDNLVDVATVKKWSEHPDGDAVHFTINGTWTAYSTVSAMIPKKKTPENSLLLISIEHFEDDEN
jgi:spore coat polysaccharide biosynthesis protein SpsF (cytidylyltransferase family)